MRGTILSRLGVVALGLAGCASSDYVPATAYAPGPVVAADRESVVRMAGTAGAEVAAASDALPPAAPAASPAAASAAAPQRQRDPKIAEAIRRGVAYLVASQNPDGSWGKATETRGFEVFSQVPGTHDGMRVATTALAVMALREAGEKEAHAKGLRHLVEHYEARRDTGMLLYNVWAHKYGLQALSIELKHATDPELKSKIKKAAEYQIDRLVRYEVYLGGWNYYDFTAQTQRPSMEATSFGTAAGLVGLWEAKRAGLEVPQQLIDRAIRRLEEMRLPTGAYLYSGDMRFAPRHGANKMRGSLGRSQSCNFALWLWDSKKVDEPKVRQGLDAFFNEHEFIEMGRQRQYPHEAWYSTAPYYYYFGHYYAGLLIARLGETGREQYGSKLASVIVPHQEADGSWWDYAMWGYHKPYGTAFSIMTLLRCD